MASGSFRARRSVDPKPIHYGSFPREWRSTSSLNDLDAAWDNVDEARSALQAVEARIHEANLGMRQKRLEESTLEEPAVREVFSQKQRLGRVSRYELRPTINEQQYPRETDLSPRRSLSEFPLNRKTSRNAYTSYDDYNGLKYSERQHSPPSRDIRSISPPYINNYTNDDTDDNDLSLQRNARTGRSREVAMPSNVLGTPNFEDSLEVSSVKRKKLNGFTPLSPLVSIPDSSDALARLKERIRKQKEKTPAPKQKENEDAVNVFQPSSDERPAIDNDEFKAKPVCTRKVVTAAPPTGYKGFSMPTSSKPKESKTQSRNGNYSSSSKAGQKRSSVQPKPSQGSDGKVLKGGVKMRRITAPKPPMDFITPYSWRTGMETVKKVLGSSNTRPKSSASTRAQSEASQDTTTTTSRMEIGKREEGKREEKGMKLREEKVVEEEKRDDTMLSDGLLSEGILSEEAKSILSDLESDKSDDEEENMKESKPVLESIRRNLNTQKDDQKPKTGKHTMPKKRVQHKQKSPETVPSKSDIQKNYDVDKVKKYMDKKIKDRKQQLRDEKKLKQEAMEGRKKRLETLYNKQKKILNTNLNQNNVKHKMGETHSVLPSHFTYQHQQIGYLPEFISQESESEKESTDVASFTGLPSPSPRGQHNHTTSDHHLASVSDASSDISEYSLDDNQLRSPRRKEDISQYSLDDNQLKSPRRKEDISQYSLDDNNLRSPRRKEEISQYSLDDNNLRSPRRNEDISQYSLDDNNLRSPRRKEEISQYSLDDNNLRSPRRNKEEEEEDDNPADVTLTPGESSYSRSRVMNGEMQEEEREEKIGYPGRIPSDEVQGSRRTDRIKALKNTAAALTNRLEQEAKRLGLSLLDKPKPEATRTSRGVTVREPEVFRGNLPGVSNLHEQAELNDELESLNSAATRIQAVYRGYSTRQGLNWRLPSGQTLGGIIRNAPRQTPIEGRAESIPLYLASDTSSDSHLSDVETAYSHESDRSFHSRNRKPEGSLDSRSYSTGPHSLQTKGAGTSSLSKGHYRPSTTLGKSLADRKGDRMSVINIYLRNLSNLRQSEDERQVEPINTQDDNDTASLYSDDFQADKTSDTASLIDDLKDDTLDLDKTLVKESTLNDSGDRIEQDHVERSPSVDRSYSNSVSSRGSPSRSPNLSQTDTEYSPIRPSMRSASPPGVTAEETTLPDQPSNRYRPPMYFPNRQGGDRVSPGSLDRQMIAELNRLEFMEESVRQLSDIEKTNAVSLAQQETVSLAQILKAKQAAYAKDMEALQFKAQKEKIDAARDLDEARYSAKKSSLDAQETIAKVKTDASNSIAQTTDRLVKAQTEASRMTTESAKKVEEARNEAARTLLDAANQQISDIGTVASTAASAAAKEAVRTTLEQYRQELRSSRKYDTSHSTPDSRSRSSYSRDSYSNERSPSYSRSRSTRSVSERRSGTSKSASGGGDGYTSDEFESFKETETARSVRTATPDRTYASNNVDGSFIGDRERSGTKSSESIAEEVDASISEGSIVSEGSMLADQSVVEAIDEHKDKEKTDHDYSMTFEESVVSSRNVTDDEMDYRLILPSEGHRRRSIEKVQRSASICSDAGTVSYSSDENVDKHLSESVHDRTTPFSGEDSFGKFTTDMVKLMREEEVRAKHLEALLHLREKALKENTKAEMDWLELQKRQMRDKGADDAMPFIKKRQRDVIKRLKNEKAEIKYLMAAHRAARHDRRLMMMNQEEITRLRRSTQKIRGKVREEEEAVVVRDKSNSDVPEELSVPTRRSTPVSTDREDDESPSKATTVPEEISAIESPTADTSFPTYENESSTSERVRKRSLSEGESDDGGPSGSMTSKSKGSPSTSDSIVMQQLKKLKSQSSERYLTQREQKLMRRKHEGEDLPLTDRKLIEWERRLADEEQNDVNRLKTKRAIKATQTLSKDDDIATMAPDRSHEGSIPEVDYVSKDISEASDHSDVETRIRELRDQLQQREREVRRLHKEQKRQKRAMLHEEEENLRKKLQAVERILQKTKENFERPATEIKPETTPTKSVKPTPAKQSTPEKSFVLDETLPSTSREGEGKRVGAPRSSSSEGSISERLVPSKDTSEEHAVSKSKQSDKSSSSDGPFKGLNVVLDLDFSSPNGEELNSVSEVKGLDFSSQNRETEPKSISEVKDLDISDRSGVFEREPSYTPFSRSEEIEDDAQTAEDISEASEIQTISGASANDEPSRSKSSRSSLPEVISKRSGDESQNSISEDISEKTAPQSGDESISEAISARSSRRSGSESISEAISARSQGSGVESISEALSVRSKRSGEESSPGIKKSDTRDVSGRRSESPANEYSNTFESEHNKDGDQTDDDISEQIIGDESRLSIKNTTPKSYSSDFELSESNIANTLDAKDKPHAASYSLDFEAPSTKVEEPSPEKSKRKSLFKEDEAEDLEQRRLSQATDDEESIAEEIPEEENDRHSLESGALSDASDEAAPLDSLVKKDKDVQQVSTHEEDKEAAEEEDISQYSQDFESSLSQRISKSLSKELEPESLHKTSKNISKEIEPESPKRLSKSLTKEREPERKPYEQVYVPGDATDEESVAEEIPEDEGGALSETDEEIAPQFTLKKQQIEGKDGQLSKDEEDNLEEKDLSQYSEDFESPSSRKLSKQSSADEQREKQKSISKGNEPKVELEVSQHRLSEDTDEESVAEELPEEDASLEVGQLSDIDEKAPQFIDATDKTSELIVSPLQPEKDIQLPKEKEEIRAPSDTKSLDKDESRRKQANKIVQDLSATLVDDAVACMSNLYEEHRHLQNEGKNIPQSPVDTTQRDSTIEAKADSEKEDSFNEWGKPPEEGFEISEGEDLSISEKLSFTDDEGSLPLFDLKPLVITAPKDDQIAKPAIEEKKAKPEIEKKKHDEKVLKDLSENLLKEAAAKMIALMRQKQAKFKSAEQASKVEKKEIPQSPPHHSPTHYSPLHSPPHHSPPHYSPPHHSPPYHSPELSPRGLDKFMAVMKQSSPPGSPTKDGSVFDGNELTDKLTQLKLLHDELGAQLGEDDDDDDDFVINANKPLELPTDKEEYGPPSGQAIPIVVPHTDDDVVSVVSTSLAAFYRRKKSGGSLGNVTPPPEFSESSVDEKDPDSKLKQSYRRMIFDLTGEVFCNVLTEESPSERPSWMKPRRRRKNRFYHTLSPVTDEHDYLPIVQQRVLDLVGLGNERPNLDTLRRKTPLKLGKKDFVDAVLIQELREDEPQWVDYDDDELAVKFQVADAIFESLMSETIMVLNAVQRRKESKRDITR